MASYPTASYNAMRLHESIRQQKEKASAYATGAAGATERSICFEMAPHQYSSKMMNSIWGLYNKYAPQAFQKNEEVMLLGPLPIPSSAKLSY